MRTNRAIRPPEPTGLCAVYGEDTLILSFDLPAGETGRLTPAELDVLTDLLAGQSNREIARRRARSSRTVANQVASILRKLGVRSRLDLVVAPPIAP